MFRLLNEEQLNNFLKGRSIVKVELRSFDDGRNDYADDPRITLDDGTALEFDVRETEVNRYGIKVYVLTKD